MTQPARHVLLSRGYRLGGRYKLLYPYAQGGMATVWLSRVRGQHGFEKLFAVKTILPHLAKDAAFRSMFLDEARIASRLRHANVAEIVDLGEDAGVLYMVIEWIQGDPWSKLQAAIQATSDPTPTDVMLRIAAGACAGLHAAHELRDEAGQPLNVVHRDVSPQNVLVTEAGAVKVIDFGVAKATDRSSEQTRAGLVKGKIEYMAPEQAMGRAVDRRADVWAMAAVLYEVFAGRPPYEANNEMLVLQKIASGDRPPPLPPSTPDDVIAVIERGLEYHPERRFESALAMQAAIERCIKTRASHEDIAACVHHYLGPVIALRRQAIADALGEVSELSMANHAQELLQPVTPSPAALETMPDSPPIAAVRTPASQAAAVPRGLGRAQRIWLVVATLVTLAVWSHALVAWTHRDRPQRSERVGP